MKEAYFTEDNIREAGEKLLASLDRFRRRHPLKIKRDRIALIVLDMQRFFLDESSPGFLPSAPAIVGNIRSLVEKFSCLGRPVIFTKHENTNNDAGMLGKWWNSIIEAGSHFAEIIEEVLPESGIIIKKASYDAFYMTGLDEFLKKNHVEQIVITGVKTNLCCETTARSGFIRGYNIIFTIDGTATDNLDFHKASLLNISHGFGIPALCREIGL